jgi:glucan phosphoethanolaminetransferase (alkaline phosphatase superfamily)
MAARRGVITITKIAQEDGRLVLSTSKSVGFVVILAMLTVGGALLWCLLNLRSDESFQRMSLADKTSIVTLIVVCIVTVAVMCRKVFPGMASVARHGEVIVLDRGRDVLLKNNARLALLSSVKAVQINVYAGTWHTQSRREPYTVSVLVQGDTELLELFAAYGVTATAGKLAAILADYLGAPITQVMRTGCPD